MKKVTSIGGIFTNVKIKAQQAWYNKHLGLQTDSYGTNFQWYQEADSTKKALLNGALLQKQQSTLHHRIKYSRLTTGSKICSGLLKNLKMED